VEHDLMGGDLVGHRGLALASGDRRSIGEATAAQLAHADLVLTIGSSPVGVTLIDHLRGQRSARADLFDTRARELFVARHSARHAATRLDPRALMPPAVPDAHGVWTLDLRSVRPVHPERFRRGLTDLAGGRVRTRGRFHLPTRPGRLGVVDGTGGHLSIGDAGLPGAPVSTRLMVTGIGDGRAQRQRAFGEMLLTGAELAGGDDWATMDDGLDEWLGPR
jgi:G3E family GTPase